jgi:3-isopropylmalate/(R)-2-methylmalate dehydratase small subunit
MEPIQTFQSRYAVLPSQNIDTDQIIPARFLKVTTRSGLGQWAFADWRYDAAGAPKSDFVLNRPAAQGVKILVVGDNFGCGSSREHAPWALYDFGFRAIISTSIADIFRNNSIKNGLLPIVVDERMHRALLDAAAVNADGTSAQVTVDLQAQTVELQGGPSCTFPIDAFAKHCLLTGVDELGFLLSQADGLAAFETRYETTYPHAATRRI